MHDLGASLKDGVKLGAGFQHLPRPLEPCGHNEPGAGTEFPPVALPESTFVFAHIIAPHPPFVFGPDGRVRSEDGTPFMFNDGDHYPRSREDYVHGYRDQTAFVIQRLMTLVEYLLSKPGPAPVIIFHGDHGPGSMLRWEDPQATDQTERMSIFAAYYFPEGQEGLYPTVTPLNGARMLANRYFGAALPLQQDKSFLSTWSRPYEFIPIR
jgi:hypothetical protein